jgi:hypothetical protein
MPEVIQNAVNLPEMMAGRKSVDAVYSTIKQWQSYIQAINHLLSALLSASSGDAYPAGAGNAVMVFWAESC